MTKEIRIYIEGGGNKAGRSELRNAFREFFRELAEGAAKRGVRLRPLPFGGRQNTFQAFKLALEDRGDAFIALLVDSETPVSVDSPWRHVKSHSGDNWDNPGVDDKHCHLMVQTMEAWLVADPEKLQEYYGRDFHDNSLPRSPNVEEIAKERIQRALKSATRRTQKGSYHKGKHAPAILRIIRPSEVKRRAPHCKRLFETLATQIGTM